MKKVLLLGALLSTMAFGAIDGAEVTKASATVNLTGQAIKQLQISAGTSSINFGTVVVNQTSQVQTSEISITQGTTGQKVKLSVSVGSGGDGVAAYFDSPGTSTKDITITGTSGTDKATVSFTYTPTVEGSLSTTATVTATYVE